MDFRKDINGLRAIAVIAVVLFHFNADWLPGGFAGVDVFFVISGFLITGIIFRALEQQRFRLSAFYLSRVRRIVPALAVLCAVLLIAGWFFLLPNAYGELGKHVASSLGFVSNLVYWKEAGYFTAAAHEKWLLHTWSLSVEWQFYLVYPLILVLLSKLVSLKTLRVLILLATAAGFAFAVTASLLWPEAAFYLLPTRAWELMVGGVAYLFPLQLAARSRRLLEGAGLIALAVGFLTLAEGDVWPGYLALIPVLGTAAIILAARQDSLVTSNGFSQWTGTLSYSLYLWHWPVVVFMSYAGLLDKTPHLLLGIAASFALGWASYTLVETRASRRKGQSGAALATGTGLLATLFLSAGAVNATDGAITPLRSISQSDRAQFVQEYLDRQKNLHDLYWLKCDAYSAFTQRHQDAIDPSCTHGQGKGGLFVWGDSHAQALSFGLRSLLPAGLPYYQVASASCKPRLTDDMGRQTETRVTCNYSNRTALEAIQRLRPEVVVMAQKADHEKTDWNAITERLHSYGVKRIVLLGPVPQWSPSLPSVIAIRHWGSTDDHIADSALDRHVLATDQAMRQARLPAGLEYISLVQRLCVEDACRVRAADGRTLLQIDDGHLSDKGSLFIVGHYLLPSLQLTPATAQR
ncbi:acyltransferase [Pseudomonas oryzihabitans]|uniref:acyltransferase family protein n=1 Tax=Pseudomonas oryzihabitans TaxID=47885 RepID=UPI001F52157A|nr:acyltransferase family protein [Pseudomonas oryzihabitans]MCI1009021.1 acyltransferase [Pseudomonas oryzihabitans]